jgi:hypothetical protein
MPILQALGNTGTILADVESNRFRPDSGPILRQFQPDSEVWSEREQFSKALQIAHDTPFPGEGNSHILNAYICSCLCAKFFRIRQMGIDSYKLSNDDWKLI